MTPDKTHKNKLVTSYPWWKYPIHRRQTSEPHGSKPFDTESDNSFTDNSNDKLNKKKLKFNDKVSNKEKEYPED